MPHTQIRRLAAALLAATGALHLVLAPEYLEEKAYIGALFILGGLPRWWSLRASGPVTTGRPGRWALSWPPTWPSASS